MGKIEKIGLNNIMGTPGALSLTGGMYVRPSLTSPMTQLTCLLPSRSQENLSIISESQEFSKEKLSPDLKKKMSPGSYDNYFTET